jgi:hypothetical protein
MLPMRAGGRLPCRPQLLELVTRQTRPPGASLSGTAWDAAAAAPQRAIAGAIAHGPSAGLAFDRAAAAFGRPQSRRARSTTGALAGVKTAA